MLQSKLSRAAGPWPQHAPCPLRPRNRTLFTDGNIAGGTSHCVSLQMSRCHDKARLLHSIGQQVGLALVLHSVSLLRMSFLPFAGLLHSIPPLAELSMASMAMIALTFTWLTPLELAACAHLANAGMHWELFALVGKSHPCPISATTEPSAPEIATTAFALFILSLCVAGVHVPRWLPWHRLLCRLLTALCMHSLRMDGACTTMAFLLPTFGKRPQEERGAARKRTATGSATFQMLLQSISQQARKPPCPWRPSSRLLELLIQSTPRERSALTMHSHTHSEVQAHSPQTVLLQSKRVHNFASKLLW